VALMTGAVPVALSTPLRAAFRDLVEVRVGIRLNGLQVAGLDDTVAAVLGSLRVKMTPAALLATFSAGGQAELFRAFVARLTIGETHFFRIAPQIAALREVVLPQLLAARAAVRRLACWSAGCSTGEEPYTLAILLRELLAETPDWHLRLLGTDLSEPALALARRARYREWSFRETPPRVRPRYFTRAGDDWLLDERVRRMVTFTPLNLVDGPLPSPGVSGGFDLILCRNVTIYFSHAVAHRLYARFAEALAPDGWLIVGPSDPAPPPASGLEGVYLPGAVLWRRAQTVASTADTSPDLIQRRSQSPRSSGSMGPIQARPVSRPLAPSAGRSTPRPSAPAPAAPPDELAAARALLARGERVAGQATLRAYVERAPLTEVAHRLLGLLALEEGDYTGALDSLRRATFLAADDPLAQFGLGRAYRALGDETRAVAAFRHARRTLAALADDAVVPGDDTLSIPHLRRAVQAQLTGTGDERGAR
jgi:chemotaxis protein methyltransferase CheR